MSKLHLAPLAISACACLVVACGSSEPTKKKSTTESCTAAEVGKMRCVGRQVQQCSNYVWTNTEFCADPRTCEAAGDSASCVGGDGSCTTGNKRCNPASPAVQRCDSNTWTNIQTCSPGVCVATSTTNAECQSETTTCTTGNKRCNTGTNSVQTCSSNTWSDTEACAPDTCVAVSATDAECQSVTSCTTSDTRCNTVTNAVQTCSSNTYTDTQPCGTGSCTTLSAHAAECRSVGSACTDSGNSDYYVCVGTTVVECEYTTGTVISDCADVSKAGVAAPGTCYDYGGTTGAECLYQVGEQCAFDFGYGSLQIYPCGSEIAPLATLGCDLDEGCVTTSATCTPSGSFTRFCSNNRLVVGCADWEATHVPELLNCGLQSNGSGTCSGTACHVGAGKPCNDDTIVCDTGTCNSIGGNGWGTCGS